MRINVLQHTPNEGPGVISEWAHQRGHEIYVYHPAQFNKLPTADETDMLVILGGPMSPNDDLPWIAKERQLIKELLAQDKPMFGACFGGQQLAMTLGATVKDAPVKEVGWAPVFLKSDVIPDLPEASTVLHWHSADVYHSQWRSAALLISRLKRTGLCLWPSRCWAAVSL